MAQETSSTSHSLTRFSSAGIMELLWISIPIILTLVSGAVMTIIDRCFLAHFATDAMNGAVLANMPVWSIQYFAITLVSIAAVFVGQFNGSKQHERVGSAVWQMIWFSLALIPFFITLGLLTGRFLFHGSPEIVAEANIYYRWMMGFGFISPLIAAVTAFFVGRGQTSLVLISTILGNLINVFLNTVLIFGIEGWIPAMGIKGAAIATIVGQAIQCVFLFCFFWNKHNVTHYGTMNTQFDWALCKSSLTIGLPAAVDRLVNVAAWTLFIFLMSGLGTVTLTVITITQSMMLFFTFVNQGIGRAVLSIAANCIGSKQWDLLWKLILSAMTLNTIFFLIYRLFFMVYPELLVGLFLPDHVETTSRTEIMNLVLMSCTWLWVAVLVDAYRWIFIGLLTAVGDTRFVMWVGSLSVWIFAIFPTYYFVAYLDVPVSYSWAFSGGYYCVVCWLYAWRFTREEWKGRLVIE